MKKLLLLTLLILSVTMTGIAQKAKNVTVTNADDFIKSIASNTNITLKISGTLKISDALDKLDKSRDVSDKESDEYAQLAPGVYYTGEFDGRAILIANINNLTINGVSANATHIQSKATYADVLRFAYCNNITVKNIKVGHVETGTCMGDVVVFSHCKNVKLENSDLYGCGVNGLTMYNTNDAKVDNTIIHDCSGNSVEMGECTNVTFNKCTMRDCAWSINDWQCSNVEYNDCDIEEHEYEGGEYDYDEGEDYYDGPDSERPMPRYLFEEVSNAQATFEKYLCDNGVNGVIYLYLGEFEGSVIVAEDCGIFAAFIPQYAGDEGYQFVFLDKADTNKGEKMGFGDGGHIVVSKEDGIYSYHIDENNLESVTHLKKISDDKVMLRHGKTKDSMKDCTEDVARPHFDFQPTDIEEYRHDHEEYPWG